MILQIGFVESILITLTLGLIGWWIRKRLEGSIQHELDKRLEEYKFSLSRREKAAAIAPVFAKWVKYRGYEAKWLSGERLIDYYEELTRSSFELVLWVDDEEFIKEVMRRFRNEGNAKDTIELLLRAREFITGTENKNLSKDDITVWPKDNSFLKEGLSAKEKDDSTEFKT